MIAIDTNLLVYAHRHESPFHQRAFECIAKLTEDIGLWAIPWPCVHEFFGIVTHPRIYKSPTPISNALRQIEYWMECPNLVLLSESSRYWTNFQEVITVGNVTGPRVHDARIAAMCSLHGVSELWSADRDFGRFPNLKVVNPLVA